MIDELFRRGYKLENRFIYSRGVYLLDCLKRLLTYPQYNKPEAKEKFLEYSIYYIQHLPSFLYMLKDPDLTTEMINNTFF